MTIRIKIRPGHDPKYNPENINVRLYRNKAKEYRWQVWEQVGDEKDIIDSSHRGWPTKEECERNANFILYNSWTVPNDNWEFDIE